MNSPNSVKNKILADVFQKIMEIRVARFFLVPKRGKYNTRPLKIKNKKNRFPKNLTKCD
jgi:hypothetical protein